ncbi:hypothetical protein ACGFRB_06340 [Streptomyces sp. NPDC048718]|uniref:hypothetical protein n=1 Tax=Streptomyces sp. NPDC048718 TaxID=3365587 RepID=UPI003711981C
MTMVGHLSKRRIRLSGAALAASLLLAACSTAGTSHQSTPTGSTAHASPPGDAESSAQTSERKLTAQVKAAMDSLSAGDKETLVASGVERVQDGVHTQPGLVKGTKYRLAVVCAGHGDVEVSFTPAEAAEPKVVPCDQSMALVRFSGSPDLLVGIAGKSGATGMIAWKVSKV